jgi:hypothetical protein
MNKNLIILGAAVIGGFVTLTAFGPKTKAEQLADIDSKVKAGLEEFRAAEAAKCDERVAAEVQTQYDAMLAAVPAIAAPMPGKKAPAKKAVKPSGPKVDPLPQPTKPANPKAEKMSPTAPNTEAKQDKMAPAPAPNTDKKKAKMGGGGR